MKSTTAVTTHKWLQLPSELVARYNSWDCKLTADLVPHMERLLEQSGNLRYWRERFWPLVPIVTAMQSRGFGELDREARNTMRARLRSEIRELEKEILDGVTGTYTDKLFNSPQQIAKLLFDEWELPKPKATRSRKSRSTDLQALSWVLDHLRKRDEPVRQRLHSLFHRSRLQTILERYLAIEGDPDGRVRPTIKLYGTETMRFAYAGGPGEAIQQWPQEVRHLIGAAPGKVFISLDYSALEARILAVLAQDKPSLEAFASGRDIHNKTVMDLFDISPEHFVEMPPVQLKPLRDFCKTVRFGLNYGGKAESLKMKLFCPCHRCVEKIPPQVNFSRDDLKRIAQKWDSLYPAVADWQTKLIEGTYGYGRDRTWTSPFGYRRRFWEPQAEGERSLKNFPLQHCGAEIINGAMRRLGKDFPFVLQLHDQLVAEVPEAEAETYMARLKEAMEFPVAELGGVVFPTDGKIGHTWADLK